MTTGIKKRARGPPFFVANRPAQAERVAPPEPSKLLLLGFLCLLGLLRCLLLRFLSHSILLGLMDGNATPRHARRRASLALSSKSIPTDSLAPAPRCHAPVITLSTVVLHFIALAPRFSHPAQHTAVILRCSPHLAASLEG